MRSFIDLDGISDVWVGVLRSDKIYLRFLWKVRQFFLEPLKLDELC
jgi:hypothetical protein